MKGIEDLVAISRKYGRDSRYVIAGGGNTSYKDADRLWVKASGHALASIDEDGFAVLDRGLLGQMGERKYSADVTEREAQVKNDLANACLTKDRRPSVETSLHNCMEASFVVHLHPTLVNGLMCSVNAEAKCAWMFPEAIYVPYTDPGYTLFKKVYDRIKAYRKEKGCEPKVIFLQNHGIFVGADSVEEIEAIYDDVMAKLGTAAGDVDAKVASEAPVCDSVSETITDCPLSVPGREGTSSYTTSCRSSRISGSGSSIRIVSSGGSSRSVAEATSDGSSSRNGLLRFAVPDSARITAAQTTTARQRMITIRFFMPHRPFLRSSERSFSK